VLRRLSALRWPFLAAVTAALVPAAVLLSGHSLAWRDTAQLTGPLRRLVVEALRDLRLPGWNPWEGAGQPLFAQYLNGVLHPVSLALAPFTDSIDALIVALVGAAAAGAWLAARALGASAVAALAAALAYGLSGFILGMSSNTTYLMSAATGPWVVAGLVVAGARPRGWIAGSLAVGALALAGDPGAVAAFSLAGAVLALRTEGRRALLPVAAACLLGLALAAVQLLPTAAYVADTARGQGVVEPGDAARWALAPWRLLELVAPGFFTGRPVSFVAPVFFALDGAASNQFPFVPSVFVGAATLVLAAVGAARGGFARWAAGLALLFLWLALGHRAGAQQALAWLPVWGALRFWEKLTAPLTLCLALASAAGVDALGAGAARPVRTAALASLGAAAALLLLLATPAGPAIFRLEDAAVAALATTRLQVGLWHAAAALAGLAALAWLAARRPAVAGWGAVALVLLQSASASPYALHAGSRAALAARPPALAAEPPGPRVLTPLACDFTSGEGELDAIDLLAQCERRSARPSTNAASRVDSFQTYSALASSRFNLVMGERTRFWRMAQRLGVTHVLSRQPTTPGERSVLLSGTGEAGPAEQHAGGELLAWALPHRPWAAFARGAESVPDAGAALVELRHALRGAAPVVVVETTRRFGPLAAGKVLSVDRRADEVTVVAESAGDSLLVLNDAWAAGWRAWIDGREVEVLPADVLVRAVPWPAGRHELRMAYEPPGLRPGAAVTLAALLLLAGGALLGRRRSARPQGR
jgi:hypothetical protein